METEKRQRRDSRQKRPASASKMPPETTPPPKTPRKGRGAITNPTGRYERFQIADFDDGWTRADEEESLLRTTVAIDSTKSIITRNDSPDVGFDRSINPYRGCEHGCVYCLAGETPILMGHGGLKALGELSVGDEIYGTERDGHYRRYVKTQVLAHWQTRKPAYRVCLADGTELVASADHRFLTDRGWKFVDRADGDEMRHRLTPNNLLMGFGSVTPSARDVAHQTEKPSADLRVVAIERLDGERDLFDITTGTGDFIANGVISHNCFARPTHAYLGLSPGLDFETKLFAKPRAAKLLEAELSRPGYRCKVMAMGTNTDPYQPLERRMRITRSILSVLARFRHPVGIVTKSDLVLRDRDILSEMAQQNLAEVSVSVTTLDRELARAMEPRAAAPERRLAAVRALREAGIPAGVLVAPVIPGINDREIEKILAACHEAGAQWAGFVLLRLPLELKQLFEEWLHAHFPDRASHVLNLIRDMRGGQLYQAEFGTRMSGTGPMAELIAQRFEKAHARLGFEGGAPLDTTLFRPPARRGETLPLFP
jgi:DNA repair photolyase